jgi:HD superfamily phosphohydrolase
MTELREQDPDQFGTYKVNQFLAEGTFGQTFKVHDLRDPESAACALKWLKETGDIVADNRFRNEEWALAHLDHPAFPKLISTGKERGRPFIVMTFAEGRTIGDRVRENIIVGATFSSMNVLIVAERLLEALAYLDNQHLMHRDIKEANVIVSASGDNVTLIDLGLCKGPVLPAQGQTIWHAGAARYAPPAKIENAAASTLTHDVFAVGVLCYHMLTNTYPWEIEPPASNLKDRMLNEAPVAIQERNNKVDDRICDLIMSMIAVHDHARIRLDDALRAVTELRAFLEQAALPSISKGPPLRLSRVFRDPIYGDVQMNVLEFAVMNTREMQRLRRIRQLGTTHLVYAGAEHSRFAHAVGVVHIVERILRAIEMREGHSFTEAERWTARLTALVHDVTHGPFGHTLEDELGFFLRHDKNQARLDRMFGADGAELPGILQATEYGRSAIDLMSRTTSARSRWIHSLLSGAVGADVLDYVDRDSYFCGLDNRIDSAIYRRFALDKAGEMIAEGKEIVPRLYGNHGFRLDADYAVISVLEARYALFMKVYSHPVKIAAGAMIGKALSLAIEESPELFDEASIEMLGDEQLVDRLDAYGPSGTKQLIVRYRDRKLYRPAFRGEMMQDAKPTVSNYRERQEKYTRLGLFDPVRRLQLERDIASESGVNANDVILYASPTAPGARSVSQKVEQTRGDFTVRDGVYSRHQDIFERHLALWSMYLFVRADLPTEDKARLAHAMQRRFSLKDLATRAHKQLVLQL